MRHATIGFVLSALVLAGPLAVTPLAAQQQMPRPAVVVAPAEMVDLRQGLSYIGRVVPEQKVDIYARVTGFLNDIHFIDGQTVAAGDLLFSIEDDTYQAAVRSAEGALRAGEAERDLARLERDRKQTLVTRNAVAQNELDVAAANLKKAEGQVTQLEAALEQRKLELSYTRITAPFAGRLGLTQVDRGALVGPASGPLVTLTRLDPMEVETQIETGLVIDFKQAQAQGNAQAVPLVHLKLPNGTPYPLDGTIDYLSANVSQGTDTVTVRAKFDNPDGLLLDGALVRVALEQPEATASLTVPQIAVQRDQAGSFVLVVGPDGKVEQRRVTIDRTTDGRAVVANGLSQGEQVIVEGLNKVRPGVVVDAAPASNG